MARRQLFPTMEDSLPTSISGPSVYRKVKTLYQASKAVQSRSFVRQCKLALQPIRWQAPRGYQPATQLPPRGLKRQLCPPRTVQVNWKILPLFSLIAGFCYLDRTNLAFASLQLNRDLGFNAQGGLQGQGTLPVPRSSHTWHHVTQRYNVPPDK